MRRERDFVVAVKGINPGLHDKFLNDKHAVACDVEHYRGGVTTSVTFVRVDNIEEIEDTLHIYFTDGDMFTLPLELIECYTLSMATVGPIAYRKTI